MINVLASLADRGGCGDYRVRFPVAAVNAREELGIYAEAVDKFDADATFTGDRYHIRQVFLPSGVHVVSVQRPTHAAMAGTLRWLKERRPDIGLVVELDDDLAAVPTGNETHGYMKNSPVENQGWLRMALACADVLTVSTPELARLYSSVNRPTFIVRNGVPTAMLDNPARTTGRRMRGGGADSLGERIVGWAGYTGTHPDDLQVTSGALAAVLGEQEGRTVRFRNVGPREGVAAGLGLREEDVEASGWLPPDLYRIALSELDIGIVPLADTRFNRCKSALKALEMAAAGVPVIASRLPEFTHLQLSGMPIWLADARRKHWVGALTRALALTDGELRDTARASREYVRRFATVDVRASEWANAWKTAAQIARTRTQAGRRTESVR